MSIPQYWTSLTAQGRQKVLAAIASNGKIEISHFAVGDGDVLSTHTNLVNLKYQSEINSLRMLEDDGALVEMFAVVPADVGGFYVREGAFYTSDGETFAIIKYPETYKPDASDNAAAELGIRAIIDVENAQVVTEKIDASKVYASREWVERTLANDLSILRDKLDADATSLAVLDTTLKSKGVATKWQELTGAVNHAFETEYSGEKYVVKRPVDDVAIAPPTTAGRTYTEFNGVDDYIRIPTIDVMIGDVVNFKFKAPAGGVTSEQLLLDGGISSTATRVLFGVKQDGNYAFSGAAVLVDGTSVSTSTKYPTDGLWHTVSYTANLNKTLEDIGAQSSGVLSFKGSICDLEVIRGGERIHYYPLRTDAIDYLAGNLVKDEEFTSKDNFELTSNASVDGNGTMYLNNHPATGQQENILLSSDMVNDGTYRIIYDYEITAGSVSVEFYNGVTDGIERFGSGKSDEILIVSNLTTFNKAIVQSKTENTTATIKNFRVIKLNELSPSASFNSATGFTLSGGVTISGGQAVFGAGAGTKLVQFGAGLVSGKKYRAVYKVNGGTTGNHRLVSGSYGHTLQSANGVFEVIFTHNNSYTAAEVKTFDGWDGNVEYFSVTEVTDGEEVGNPTHTFENYWAKQLDSKDIATKSDIDTGTSTSLVPSVKAVKEAINAITTETLNAVNANSLSSDSEFLAGTDSKIPDAKQIMGYLKSFGFGAQWEDLTGSVGYQFETNYRNGKYLVRNPMPDVTLAPPTTAGRTYTNFDGTSQYITIPTINLVAGDVVKFKFKAPTSIPTAWQALIDGVTDPLVVYITSTGKYFYSSDVNLYADGVLCTSNVTNYPQDGLMHNIELILSSPKTLSHIAVKNNITLAYKGRIYDLEVIRGGNRIHYYPLRNDAIDYKAGNLIKDEEFTSKDNWVLSGVSISDNKAIFGGSGTKSIKDDSAKPTIDSTVRVIYEITEYVSGSIKASFAGSQDLSTQSGSGVKDEIAVINGTPTNTNLYSSDFVGSIKNFRVIKLNELSPSASFSSATGFTLSGGVTISGGQAIFGSGAGTKSVKFKNATIVSGKTYRVVYKTNGTSTGSFRVSFSGVLDLTERNSDGIYDETVILPSTPLDANVYTSNGWDGNVEYFSVTEVTDGTEVGNPTHTFENYWAKQLDGNDVGKQEDLIEGSSTSLVPSVKAVRDEIDKVKLQTSGNLLEHGVGTQLSMQSVNFINRSFDLRIDGNGRVPFPDLPATACDILVHGLTDETETYTSFVGRFVKYGSTWSAVNIYGATGSVNHPTIEIFNNKPHFKNPHASTYPYSFHCQIACQNSGNAKPFEFYQNLYSTANLPTKLVDGALSIEKNVFGALRTSVPFGTLDSGALNTAHWHFKTSLPSFYFDKTIHVKGEIYAGESYKNRVYHEGNKPTASDVGAQPASTKLTELSNSQINLYGREVVINSKRALVGFSENEGNNLTINFGKDWPLVNGLGDWAFGSDVSVYGDLKLAGDDSYIWTPNKENGFFGIYDPYRNIKPMRYAFDTGFMYESDITVKKNNPWLTLESNPAGDLQSQAAGISIGESGRHDAASFHIAYRADGQTYIGMGSLIENVPEHWAMQLNWTTSWVRFRSSIQFEDDKTVVSKGVNDSTRITTPSGWLEIGPQNTFFSHFKTDRSAFHFDKKVSVQGEIYAGTGYDKRVYHEGYKPTANDVGAFTAHKKLVTVSNSEYTTIAKVTGERFSSIITIALFGTADSTVVSFKADVLVHHSGQTYVYSQNGGYSAISLKILSNNNEKYCIQAKIIGSKSAPLICTIQAFANEVIEFNPADISGFSNEHIHNSRKCGYAITSKYDSTGISINGNEVADARNIHQLLQSSVNKPASGSLSLGENHLTTNNTIKLPATTNLAVDSVVKVTKRFSVTPQIEVNNPATDKIAFFKDRVVQFDTAITFDVGTILTFILNDKKEWELQ
ncbi:phage tail protein [Pseudoalteromonas xiamenensis]|uniref:phage tail-collar fiber domain-containing protein n=1 Tax=Pseudoalteromonas xiamenensis TaxID=882626 RepID=UPI0027E3DD32|nr:phage tail protein [Pseudoalteromonas xiamenensis]WMN59270.1 phage tail protein [Pseudoalteromonas xiamenensis]